jgi:short-subunit dehydrogenase
MHILITGASSGIGAALAQQYAVSSVRLSLHGRNAERIASVAESARQRGAVVNTQVGDVTNAAGMTACINACDAQQSLDLVIANAGISAGTSGRPESAEQARTIFAANLTGVLNTIHPAVPLMTARKRGQIAIISSLASFRGFPGAPAYCASKAAVRIYGEALRGGLAPYGVAVNVVCPGFIKTPMTDVNPFPMPLIMSAERAARIIQTGLAQDRARIAFPWLMYMGVRLLVGMPQGLLDAVTVRMPRKLPLG